MRLILCIFILTGGVALSGVGCRPREAVFTRVLVHAELLPHVLLK